MKNNKLLIAISLLCLLLLVAVGILNTKESSYQAKYHWKQDPMILACYDSTPTSEALSKAVKYWEVLGYDNVGIINEFNCPIDGRVEGAITLGLPTSGYDYSKIAMARAIVDLETQEIYSVRIEILYLQERVLEHEFGHAYGFEDIDVSGNIMNSNINNGGWNSDGLKKKN